MIDIKNVELFTDEELKKIVYNTVAGMEGTATDESIQEVLDWCYQQRTGYHLVELIIHGAIFPIGFKDGEPGFSLAPPDNFVPYEEQLKLAKKKKKR